MLSPSIFSPVPNVIPTSAGITTSDVAVKLILAPDAIVKSVPSPDIFSPESANLSSLPDATNNADTSPSSLNTSVAEPPSFTVNIKSLLDVALATVTSPLDAVIPTPAFTVSEPTSNAAKEESVTDVASAAELDNTALNESSPSFQYNTALLPADPRCTNIPASTSAPPELFLLSSNNASCISKFVVFTDVVVPDTVRLPPTCKFPPNSPLPLAVKFLKSPISLLESTTTALEAATVPAVNPSICSRSASLISADPITKVPLVVAPVAVIFLNEPASLFPSTTTALFAATVPLVIPSSFSRSASFIDAEPMMKDPVAVTSALTTTFALKFVTSLTSIALESIAFISDTNKPPTTSRPSFILIFDESVDNIELTSSIAVFTVPVAVTFLNEAMSLFESTTTALDAATVPAVMPSIVSSSASLMFAEPIINPVAVTVSLKVAAPAADISSVSAVMPEPPSLPCKIISLSDTNDLIVKLSLSKLT